LAGRRSYQKLFWATAIAALLLGAASSLPAAPSQRASPVINEVMASNGTGLADQDGDFSDWIEIYNPTSQPVNLAGWALTDDPGDPQKWSFPDMTLHGQEYRVIFASGKDRKAGELHTNFRLSKSGEFLGLYHVLDDRFADVISPLFPPQLRDVAYGRSGDRSTYSYLGRPTPGGPNNSNENWTEVISTVEFSPPRGFYTSPVTVVLTTTIPEAEIRYTTDGSEPVEANGAIYTGPITLDKTTLLRAAAFKAGFLSSEVKTHSYIFLDQVIHQPSDPPGWPAAWGVYNEYYPGLPPKGAPVPADYEMDPRIVEDPQYQDTIIDSLLSIPSLSLVTVPKNFDIYARAVERGEAWERPVSVELIDPNDPARNFQINAGIRMQGVSNRWEFMPKKSFRLFFKGEYGHTKLEYPLFAGSPVNEFDTLVLRGGANRSYAGYPDASVDLTQTTYTRDEWMRASQIAISGVGSHGRFVHLYLNGLYWGLYNLVERPDASFASAHLGGQKEDWFAAKHGGTILDPEATAQGQEPQIIYREEIGGSNERYEALLRLIDEGNLADPERYQLIKQYVDTVQFSDYIILNLYAGNRDWGDNNWYIGMRNTPPGPLKYFVWDAELTWDKGARLYLGKTSSHHKMRPLFLALIENPDFRIEFADRMYRHLFNDGALTDANAQARWLQLANQVDRAIVAESARWGDARYTDNPIDHEDWVRARDKVLVQMEGNGAKLIALAREAGYYPPLDPPLFSRQGGEVAAGFEVTITVSPTKDEGTVYYTTDGSDPRLPVTGEVAPAARLYNDSLVLTATTHLKARTLAGDIWSALNEALFEIDSAQGHLQLTEIMYNPVEGAEYEFIELKNVGNAELVLAGVSFEGITFTFPPGVSSLAPEQFAVLVRNPAAFAGRYPDVAIAGVYEGRLSDKGEQLTVKDSWGNPLISLAYDDENGWPVSADGQGDSLVLANSQADPANPKNWRASGQVGGTPGADEVELGQ
jgi:hypothetical protein